MDIKWLLFSFDGRLNRQPYWIVVLVMGLVSGGFQQYLYGYGPMGGPAAGEGLISLALAILSLWIGLAVQIKRWHDRDKSGWWALLNFVPVLGWIWILVECGFLRGTYGDNRFGRDVLAETR